MDPYIERPVIWADFHDALITYIRGELQPLLRPRYVALAQDRLYVVESQRPIFPDIAVVEAKSAAWNNGATAVLEVETPVVFELAEEEIREPYLEIVEAAAGNRMVTTIEVLSPANKTPGVGREQYLKKCLEVRDAGANLVEIDLLRAGKPTLRVDPAGLAKLPPCHYLLGVMRPPTRQEVYPLQLRRRLPTIAIPLGAGDPDVVLDLQSAFTLAWQKGPYPALLNYDGPPPGQMTPDDIAWCEQQLRQAGLRAAPASP